MKKSWWNRREKVYVEHGRTLEVAQKYSTPES